MTAQKDPEILGDKVTELAVHMGIILKAIERLDEANEGTLRTRGMKERLTMAEGNIQANKEAWGKVDRHIGEVEARINTTLREAFTEVEKKINSISIENQSQKIIIQRWSPYINVIAWLVTAAGGVLLMLILSGQLTIIRP